MVIKPKPEAVFFLAASFRKARLRILKVKQVFGESVQIPCISLGKLPAGAFAAWA